MIELSDVFWLSVLVFSGWYWLKAREIKELALKAVREHCKKMDVELLDESVVLKGFWFKRDRRGVMRQWRSYLFEFSSDGDDRYKGRVILLGNKLETVSLDAHRLPLGD